METFSADATAKTLNVAGELSGTVRDRESRTTSGGALGWLVLAGLALVLGTVTAAAAPSGSLAGIRNRGRAAMRACATAIRRALKRPVVDEDFDEDASDALIQHLERMEAGGDAFDDALGGQRRDAEQEPPMH